MLGVAYWTWAVKGWRLLQPANEHQELQRVEEEAVVPSARGRRTTHVITRDLIMTNANFKDDTAPRFDREVVHAHISLLHDLAGRARADLGIDGQLVLACYGENPDTGVKIASQVMKFGIGHGLEEMVDVIMALEHHLHLNVYAPFHIVRFGLGARERGGLGDIVAVLALVVDQDADKEKAGELPLPPHYVMESSRGNKQSVYVLAKAMRVEDAYPYAKALQRFTGTDSGTADVAHVWRVPGTLNWPNKQKVHKRNRPRTPQSVRVLEPWQGELVDADALRAKLGERFWRDEKPGDHPDVKPDWATSANREALLARLTDSGALEIISWFDVACIDKDNGDRSSHSCRVIMKLFELGFSEGDVLVLMLGTECAKRYTSGKHLRDDIARLKQKKATEELPEYVKRLNQDHAVVLMEGQVLIVREQDSVPHFISLADFHLWHANDMVEIQVSYGKTKRTPVSGLWISHAARRQYSRVVFDPRDTNPLHYNLWRGFAVTADASKEMRQVSGAHSRQHLQRQQGLL
jgi:hypothetical protein